MSNDDDNTQSFVALTKGTMVSHYRIVEKIGAGGMGEVYLAEDTELGRKVALKFLPSHLCQDQSCRARFKREARAVAALSHPNIVTIFEVGEFSGRPFFAMEHVPGETLGSLIKQGKLGIDEAIRLTMQICEGLHQAHESGVVHRDIKPGNIIIDNDGRARLLDFGLAMVSGEDKLTKTGSTLGTAGYMSPGQVSGKQVDHRSDLFSVGVILYEMLTGRRPFEGDNDAAVVNAITNSTPEPVARFKSGVTSELQQVVEKALSKDPALRYQHADGMLADLKRLTIESPTREQSRSGLWIAGIIVVLAAAIGLVITKPWLDEPTADQPRKIMLAVLPFDNLGDPDDEYFADGITDEIISRLAKLSGLGVISRTSAIQYKNSDKSLPEIAAELGVDFILEGTIRWDKTSDTQRVRITPQLIQVSDNTHIWTDVYERAITSIFSIQSEIATHISNAFGIVLLNAERDLIERQPTENFEAYQHYLRARSFLDRSTNLTSAIRTGIQYLDSAIAKDSSYALAYAELSIAHARIYHSHADRGEERQQLAREAAARALELEPSLPEASFAMGSYHYRVMRDYEAAISMLDLALQGKPNDSRVYTLLGYVERRSGRFDDAVEHFLQALRLNPRDAGVAWEIANTYMRMKEYALADEYCLISLNIEANQGDAQIILVRNSWRWYGSADSTRALVDTALSKYIGMVLEPYLQLIYDGSYLEAVELCDSLSNNRLWHGSWAYPGDQLRGWAYFLKGDLDSARTHFQSAATELEERLKTPSSPFRTLSELGIVYAYLGKTDEAMKHARRGVELLPVSKDAMDGPDRLQDLALVLAIAGHHDEAVSLIDSLLRIPSGLSVPLLRLDKRWTPLYDNPRFQTLLEKYESEHE